MSRVSVKLVREDDCSSCRRKMWMLAEFPLIRDGYNSSTLKLCAPCLSKGAAVFGSDARRVDCSMSVTHQYVTDIDEQQWDRGDPCVFCRVSYRDHSWTCSKCDADVVNHVVDHDCIKYLKGIIAANAADAARRSLP